MLKHPTQVKPSSLANDALVVHELLHEALEMGIAHANEKKWYVTRTMSHWGPIHSDYWLIANWCILKAST